jgi:fatty acid desaturase
MKTRGIHRADIAPALIITSATLLAFVPFIAPAPVIVIALFSFAGRMIAPVHQHCHSHKKLFSSPILNHFYDFVLMLAAGNITAIWELQHVVGHHRSHLNPAKDPASVTRFGRSRLLFTVAGDALSFTDSLAVARREGLPTTRLWGQKALQTALTVALLCWNAPLALALFIVPNLFFRWMVFYISWDQHADAPNHDVYSGSITRFGWTNAVFLNVGHHTAHHEKPTLHWTLLPARTERIRARIPATCLRGSA